MNFIVPWTSGADPDVYLLSGADLSTKEVRESLSLPSLRLRVVLEQRTLFTLKVYDNMTFKMYPTMDR